MHLNLKKIDERIEKRQEVRRIASDQELVSMLFEFIRNEDQPDPVSTRVAPPMNEADIISQVVKGPEVSEGGLWSRKRA